MKSVSEFLSKWGMVIMVPMMIIVFFKGCSSSSTANKTNETVEAQTVTIDSLNNELAKRPTTKEVRDEMEKVMLDFLIYEDELDKKQITVSQIKDKIESND